jgi:hypothetical protein
VSSLTKDNVLYRTIRISTLPSYDIAHEIVKRMETLHDMNQSSDIVPIDYRIVRSHTFIPTREVQEAMRKQYKYVAPPEVNLAHLWLTFGNELTMWRFVQCMPYYGMYVPHLHAEMIREPYWKHGRADRLKWYHVGLTYAYEHKEGQQFITRRQRLIDIVHHSLPSLTHHDHAHHVVYTPIAIKCARCEDCQRGTLIELITSYCPLLTQN